MLADAGLVSAEKLGRQRLYRVEHDGVRRLLQREIESFWTAELDPLVADAHRLAPTLPIPIPSPSPPPDHEKAPSR